MKGHWSQTSLRKQHMMMLNDTEPIIYLSGRETHYEKKLLLTFLLRTKDISYLTRKFNVFF